MPAVNPYLTFDGNCEEAFEFYRAGIGGEFATKMRFKDGGEACGQMNLSESEANRIMHVALPIGNGTVLMASDIPSSQGPIHNGDNFAITLSVDSESEADRVFNNLSAGGNVIMPLGKVFWGAYFGMFSDKFGIKWMVSYDYNRHQ